MNIGFTIGKFAPLHKGHQQLIEKGLSENDEFYILINDTNVTKIPLEIRANWLKELYPKAHIILGKNPPMQYGLDEESIKIQTNYLKSIFKDIPVTNFYSSEEYGKYVARDLNVNNIHVEKNIPICSTNIRKNPEDNRIYMNNSVFKDFKIYHSA